MGVAQAGAYGQPTCAYVSGPRSNLTAALREESLSPPTDFLSLVTFAQVWLEDAKRLRAGCLEELYQAHEEACGWRRQGGAVGDGLGRALPLEKLADPHAGAWHACFARCETVTPDGKMIAGGINAI